MDVSNDLTRELLHHQAWLVRLARHLVARPDEAETVVQETWVAALRRPPETDRPLRPWLATVARNAARQLRRGRSRREEREQIAARDEALPGSDELAERVELQRELAGMLADLDEPYRGTLMLRYVEGLSAAEIARRQGEPAGTIRWRLKVGLDQLRARLDDVHGDRNTWCMLLAPIAASRGGAAVGAASPLLWILTMKSVLKLAAVITLALLTGVYLLQPGGDPDLQGPRPATPAEAQTLEMAAGTASDDPVMTSARSEVPEEAGPLADPAESEELVLLALLVDGSGQALSGVQVALSLTETFSASDGTVRLPAGGDEFAYAQTIHFEREDLAPAERVLPAHVRGQHDLGRIVLHRGGRLAGIVVDETGAPVADAEVEAKPARDSLPSTETVGLSKAALRTGPDGRFELTRLVPGFHSVMARAAGTTTGRSAAVRVVAGETSLDVQVVVERLAVEDHVRGIVLRADGTPCPGARLEILGSLDSERADEEGRFLIHAPVPLDLMARDRRDTSHFALARGLQPGTAGHELRLEPSPTLRVRVIDQDEQPVAAAGVELHTAPEGEFRAEGVTYSGGQRWLSSVEPSTTPGLLEIEVPPVDFEVRVSAPGYQEQRIGPLDRDGQQDELEVVLVGLEHLHGRVTMAGEPVVGASVSLHPRPDPAMLYQRNGFPLLALNRVGATVETDEEGRFALPIEDDEMVETTWGWFVVALTENGARTRSEPVLPGDVGRRGIVLELSEPGEIEGRLLAHPREDVAGCLIIATDGYGDFAVEETDDQGRFLFEGLAPGAWIVRRHPEGPRARLGREIELMNLVEGGHFAGTRPEGLPDIEWSVVVRPGERVRFDLDLDALPMTRLQGQVRIDGLAPGPWRVHLLPQDREGLPNHVGLSYIRQSTQLDDEGRFSVEAPLQGAHDLVLMGATADGAPCILAASLDLRGGFVEWSEAWTTAPLSGRGPQELRHRRVLEGGATIWTTLEVDEGGRFSVRAPCGAGHVTRGDTDRPWLEPASEVLSLDLPQQGLTGLVIED